MKFVSGMDGYGKLIFGWRGPGIVCHRVLHRWCFFVRGRYGVGFLNNNGIFCTIVFVHVLYLLGCRMGVEPWGVAVDA